MDVIILDMGPDVKGESTLKGYEGKIELLSFTQGAETQHMDDISSGGRSSGGRDPKKMVVMKYNDSVSPKLYEAVTAWQDFPEVKIILLRDDDGMMLETLRYTLKGVHISDFRVGGGGGDKPVDTLTFDYNQISFDYPSHRPGPNEPGAAESK